MAHLSIKDIPGHLALLSYEQRLLEQYIAASRIDRKVILANAIKDRLTSGPLITAYRAVEE